MTSLPNETLNDEITSINSIYDPETLSAISEKEQIYSLRLPSFPSIALRIEFPPKYPDAPPSILGTQTVGDDVQKGIGTQVVEIVRGVLSEVYRPGEACIFDLLEEAREALENAPELQHDDAADENAENVQERGKEADDEVLRMETPPWILAPPVTEKKSLFLARAAPVSSPTQAKLYIRHLLATDKRAAKATHNITAWRIRGENGSVYQDCDDDGETAAGGRLLHLLQLMDVWDVMVVVTRWYGGVLLGPARFGIICNVGREALVVGGWGKGEGAKKGKR